MDNRERIKLLVALLGAPGALGFAPGEGRRPVAGAGNFHAGAARGGAFGRPSGGGEGASVGSQSQALTDRRIVQNRVGRHHGAGRAGGSSTALGFNPFIGLAAAGSALIASGAALLLKPLTGSGKEKKRTRNERSNRRKAPKRKIIDIIDWPDDLNKEKGMRERTGLGWTNDKTDDVETDSVYARMLVEQMRGATLDTVETVADVGVEREGFLGDLEICDATDPKVLCQCAAKLTLYLNAVAEGGADVTPEIALLISDYLDSIASRPKATGKPLTKWAVTSYLNLVRSEVTFPPSEAALESYLNSLANGALAAPSSAAAISFNLANYVENPTIPPPSNGEPLSDVGTHQDEPPGRVRDVTLPSAPIDYSEPAASQPSIGDYPWPVVQIAAPIPYTTITPLQSTIDPTPADKGVASDPVAPLPTTFDEVKPDPAPAQLPSAVDNVPVAYLDTLYEECNAKKRSERCAPAITSYLDALSTGAIQPSKLATAGISSYMDEIAPDELARDRNVKSYLETYRGVSSYLEGISSGKVGPPSSDMMKSYLQQLRSGDATDPMTALGYVSYLADKNDNQMAGLIRQPVQANEPSIVENDTAATTLMDEITEVCVAPAVIASTESFPTESAGAPSTECASAITNYLDALSVGAVEPSRLASAGISSYLDTISDDAVVSGGGSGIASYVDGVGSVGALDISGAVEAARIAAAARAAAPVDATEAAVSEYMANVSSGEVESPSSSQVKGYLDAVSSGSESAPEAAKSIFDYLASLGGSGAAVSPGVRAPSYLDSVAASDGPSVSSGGDGVPGYLDTINEIEEVLLDEITEVCAAPATISASEALNTDVIQEPSTECASAITNYLDALSAGAVEPCRLASAGISSYLETISDDAVVSGGGSGIASYVDGVGSVGALDFSGAVEAARIAAAARAAAPVDATESAVTDYMELLASGAVASPPSATLESYLGDVVEGTISLPSTPDAISSYMDAATSKSTSIDTTTDEEGMATVTKVTRLVIEDVEEELLGEITEVCAAPAAIASFSGERSEAVGSVSPSTECASAITNYLDALSSGAVEPSRLASAGISSYLDTISDGVGVSGGGSGIASYLDGVGSVGALDFSGAVEAARVASAARAAAPVDATEAAVFDYMDRLAGGMMEAPSSSQVKGYLDAVSSGSESAPEAAKSISDYLASLGGSGAAVSPGVRAPSYLDSVAASDGPSVSSGGDGVPGYLDTINEVCISPAVAARSSAASVGGRGESVSVTPSSECASAITNYLDALSAGVVEPDRVASAGISSYLDTISGGVGVSEGGSGMGSYMKDVGDAKALRFSRFRARSPAPSPSAAAMEGEDGGTSGGYADADSMGSSSSSSSPTEAAVSSFLEGIASGTVASPPSATLESYLGDVVEGRVSLPSTPDAITSYMDAATSKSTSIDTTTDEEGMATVTKVTRLVIEDVEEELLGEITEVCAAPAAIASFSGERSEAVGSVSPSTECASAITNYLDALSSGAVEPSRLASAGISSYLDTISDGVGVSGGGSGIASYLDGVGSAGALDFSGAVEAARVAAAARAAAPVDATEAAVSEYMANRLRRA